MIRMGTGQATDSIPYDLHSPRLDIHVLRCSVLLTSVRAVHGCVIVEHLPDSKYLNNKYLEAKSLGMITKNAHSKMLSKAKI